jgi:hypothetical protein
MLELRPTCEQCNKPLPPDSTEAMICSFECTFCASCVETILHNVCPNCGGGFSPRPIRPKKNWRGGNDCTHYPPSQSVKHRPVNRAEHESFIAKLKDVPPRAR